MTLDYFYGQAGELFSFYRIPKALFQEPRFQSLSTDAKTLYGILLDRMSLSVKNGWLDEQNRVFIIFTIEDVKRALCCADNKATKLLRELEKFGLIERKRRGQGKPSLVYVKNFSAESSKESVKNRDNDDSCGFKIACQDPAKPRCNKTKKNDTEMSETDPFYSEEADGMSKRTQLEEYFSQSLEVELLLRLCPDDEDTIYQIVDLLVDTCATNRKLLRIAGDDKPAEVVRSRFMKLNADHIRFVLKCLAENSSPMPKNSLNVSLKGADDIFSTEESRQERQREQVQQIPIGELFPFKNHPFKVLDDESMQRTVESVEQYGVLSPLIARPRPEGGYEIISGHRRQYAAKLAGLDTLPVIVRQMSDDAAVILMVDSNLQREHILPSERALAYKMKLEAIKNQGARSDLTSAQVGRKLEAADIVGQEAGDSRNQVRRFIRLTNLIPELLDMVDEKKISFNPAVELSYLDESQQRAFLEAMDGTQNAPSVSQAQQLKKMAQCGEFTYEKAFDILGQEKKSEQDTVTIKNDILRKYFPRSYTPRQMEEKIIQLLDAWQKKQQRHNER